MSDFGKRLHEIRLERGMSQEELASLLGTSKQVISRYENNQRSPKISVAVEYAKRLGVPLSALSDSDEAGDRSYSNLIPAAQLKMRRVPVLGPVAAGTPILADRDYDEYAEVPEDGVGRFDAALRVEGDSMEPLYLDGDLVFIRYQDDVEDGQVAAVCVDDSVTLKRVYHIPHGVQLVSENRKYAPMIFTNEDASDIHLVGLAVGFLRWKG